MRRPGRLVRAYRRSGARLKAAADAIRVVTRPNDDCTVVGLPLPSPRFDAVSLVVSPRVRRESRRVLGAMAAVSLGLRLADSRRCPVSGTFRFFEDGPGVDIPRPRVYTPSVLAFPTDSHRAPAPSEQTR
jgi:hypothetical protein